MHTLHVLHVHLIFFVFLFSWTEGVIDVFALDLIERKKTIGWIKLLVVSSFSVSLYLNHINRKIQLVVLWT